jgi:hypothetical protein
MSEEQQQEKGKEGKKYADNIQKLISLLSGEDLLTKSRIPNGDVQIAMAELVKEEKTARVSTIKEATKSLIKKKTEFDVFQKQERAKFERAVEDKQKEFNQEANKIFSMIEDIKQIEEDYLATLTSAATPPIDEKPDTLIHD